MPVEQFQPSPEQAAQTKVDAERKRWAKRNQPIASEHPNTLVESRTVRNPLVPQPEPDADPLQPLIQRPSRSRNSENNYDKAKVAETRTGSAEAPHTEVKKESQPPPQPAPQAVAVAVDPSMHRDELEQIARDAGIAEPATIKPKDKLVRAIRRAQK
jgi:hypothetical protein